MRPEQIPQRGRKLDLERVFSGMDQLGDREGGKTVRPESGLFVVEPDAVRIRSHRYEAQQLDLFRFARGQLELLAQRELAGEEREALPDKVRRIELSAGCRRAEFETAAEPFRTAQQRLDPAGVADREVAVKIDALDFGIVGQHVVLGFEAAEIRSSRA